MIWTVWFRFRYFLQFLFTKDPVEEWMNKVFDTTKQHYDERITQFEMQIVELNKIIEERNASIYELQNEIIHYLRPKEVINQEVNQETPTVSTGWAAQRSRLEEISSRKRREDILGQVAKREAEIEEALKTPGADILSPVLDR